MYGYMILWCLVIGLKINNNDHGLFCIKWKPMIHDCILMNNLLTTSKVIFSYCNKVLIISLNQIRTFINLSQKYMEYNNERLKMDYKTSKKIYILLLLIFCFGAPVKAENDASTSISTDEIEKGNFDLM